MSSAKIPRNIIFFFRFSCSEVLGFPGLPKSTHSPADDCGQIGNALHEKFYAVLDQSVGQQGQILE
jgi:hypothetical protein